MYLRKKTIRNKKTGGSYTYAYLVENTWKKKGSRQKVKGYLGKVLVFGKKERSDFFSFASRGLEGFSKEKYLKETPYLSLVKTLVLWELSLHEIPKEIKIDLELGKVLFGKKEVGIELNEGIFCSYTLGRLLRFSPKESGEKVGYALAKAFVEGGVVVSQEVFVELYSKLIERGSA